MCTITNEVLTDENEEVVPRTLNELLLMDSYQDMSDTEINMIIDYKIELAKNDAIVQAAIEAENTRMTESIALQRETCRVSETMLQSTLEAIKPVINYVQPNGVELRNIEV